ncbi:MAG TPA: hypothetical protein VFE30_07805 [Anaeromyxobacteraceae bacterium]|jgi:hypothetical protein|nr:hypothetical protein [Anaeromyxobacteraceae bacterium]
MKAKRRVLPGFPNQRGEITWVTVMLVLLLAGGGYAGWVGFPIFWTHLEAKQVVKDYANRAIKNADDESLKRGLVRDLASLGKDPGEAPDGTPALRPSVNVQPNELVWERGGTAEAPTLHVAFEYDRHVPLPFMTDRYLDRHFGVDLDLDISRADWGRER